MNRQSGDPIMQILFLGSLWRFPWWSMQVSLLERLKLAMEFQLFSQSAQLHCLVASGLRQHAAMPQCSMQHVFGSFFTHEQHLRVKV